MKAAIEAAQYVHPKLAVTATVTFADQLEKAVERSRKVSPMIDVSSDNVSSEASDTKRPATNGGKPMMIPDRRYR